MENNCFITFVDEKYITCIIRQMQRIAHLKTKYPYIILVDAEDLYTQSELKNHQINFELVSNETFTSPIEETSENMRFRKTFNKFKILNYLTQYNKVCWVDADIIFIKNQDHIFEIPENIIYKGTKNDIDQIDGSMFILTQALNIKNFKTIIYDCQNYCYTDEEILNMCFLNHSKSLFVEQISGILHMGGKYKLYMFPDISFIFKDINAIEFNQFLDNYYGLFNEAQDNWTIALSQLLHLVYKIKDIFNKQINNRYT